MIIRLTFPLTRIMKSQRQWLNHLKKKNCVKIKTMKTKNIDATRINVTQICYYFIEKKVSLNKIILLRCKLVIGFSFFLVHFLTQKVWAEKICIHFHAKGDLPFLGGETATIQTLETRIFEGTDAVPKWDQRKANKETKCSPEFCHQGRVWVDHFLSLDLYLARHRPKRIYEVLRFESWWRVMASNKGVFLVFAGLPAYIQWVGKFHQNLKLSVCWRLIHISCRVCTNGWHTFLVATWSLVNYPL